MGETYYTSLKPGTGSGSAAGKTKLPLFFKSYTNKSENKDSDIKDESIMPHDSKDIDDKQEKKS